MSWREMEGRVVQRLRQDARRIDVAPKERQQLAHFRDVQPVVLRQGKHQPADGGTQQRRSEGTAAHG